MLIDAVGRVSLTQGPTDMQKSLWREFSPVNHLKHASQSPVFMVYNAEDQPIRELTETPIIARDTATQWIA